MSEVLIFKSTPKVHPRENINNLIEFARKKLSPTQPDIIFDQDYWPSKNLQPNTSHGNFIYFARIEFRATTEKHKSNTPKRNPAPVSSLMSLAEPLKSTVKALILQEDIPKRTSSLTTSLDAYKIIENELRKQSAIICLSLVTPHTLNCCCNYAIENYSHDRAYSIGKKLESIYKRLTELNLILAPTIWKSIIAPPKSNDSIRVGPDFNKARADKLPSPEALHALAEIFNSPDITPAETVATSCSVLLLCAPGRISEVFQLSIHAIDSTWIDPDTGELGTGLRWLPKKGGKPTIKTIIPSMRDIAIRAVNYLLYLSSPARKIALWYEENPKSVYLPKEIEHLRSKTLLTTHEAKSIVYGGDCSKSTGSELIRIRTWLRNRNISPRRKPDEAKRYYCFKTIEREILEMLPDGFPIMNSDSKMKYSEALCIARPFEINNTKIVTPIQCAFTPVTYEKFSKFLKSQNRSRSIFQQRGYVDKNGKYLELKSHMFRHYLNTLIRGSGSLSEEDIARWSGRKSINQNAPYNHQSDRDVISKLPNALGHSKPKEEIFESISDRVFIRRSEFSSLDIVTAHTTEFGYCSHDYSQEPCQNFGDCTNCPDQFCIKGDLKAEENLTTLVDELTYLQNKAKDAITAETLGATEWFTHHTVTLSRAAELLSLMKNPEIPNGSVIKLEIPRLPSKIELATKKLKSNSTSATESSPTTRKKKSCRI